MQNNTENTINESTLIKAKKHFMSQLSNIIGGIICITLGIVVLACMGGWVEEICEAIAESMIKGSLESGSLTGLKDAEKMVNIVRPILKVAFSAFGAILIVFSIIKLILGFLRLGSTQLTLTNKRIIGKTGLTHVKKTDLLISEITNIAITTTFWGRIFKFDNIEIRGSTDVSSVTYKGIANAEDIRNAIGTLREQN